MNGGIFVKIFVDSELMGQSAYFGWQDKDEALYGLREGYKISKPLKYKFTDRKDYKFNMKRKYVIWAWKGDYLNLWAGCEVGFYNTYGSTKHYFFVKKIFTELEMRYNGNLINNYRPPKSKGEKVGHSWWITTFNAGMQNNVNPSKIGFRCVADLSVLKAYARKALERRLEKSKRWNVEGNKATLKWNY